MNESPPGPTASLFSFHWQQVFLIVQLIEVRCGLRANRFSALSEERDVGPKKFNVIAAIAAVKFICPYVICFRNFRF